MIRYINAYLKLLLIYKTGNQCYVLRIILTSKVCDGRIQLNLESMDTCEKVSIWLAFSQY